VRIERLRNELRMTGTVFGAKLGVSSMAVSRWENGDNEPPGKCYARMGNMALTPKTRLYFWEQAGVDVTLIPGVVREASEKPRLFSKGSKRCG
jgi:transcriptional regulator with XRE-family HTH domain